jgi:hypothetical protein
MSLQTFAISGKSVELSGMERFVASSPLFSSCRLEAEACDAAVEQLAG